MGDYRRQVPDGLGDILADECAVKRTVETAIRDVFLGYGLREVSTPTFEYLDVFSTRQAVLEQEQMFKLTDPKGRILVIRPDVTIPIARMAATNMKAQPKPLKLFYISDVFREASGQREFTQAGVEMIGVPGIETDGECISMAVGALKTAGIEDFRIDIGQVKFFESIIDEINITDDDKESLRHYIKHKNLVAVEEFLDGKGVNGGLKELLLLVPVLYGEVGEIIKLAREFPLNDGAAKALVDIEKAYQIIKEYGYEKYVSIDLGMVKELSYYTGIIFKGFTRDLGFIICSGGRYDDLQQEFGKKAPATGFAINVNRVVQALYKQNRQQEYGQKSYILVCSGPDRKKAINTAQRMRSAGLYIELDMTEANIEQVMAYAKAKGVKKIIIPEEGSRLRVVNLDTGKQTITSIPGIIAGLSLDRNKCISGWH
jgi:ATP phosphoribosyltransferase regulatory subunit